MATNVCTCGHSRGWHLGYNSDGRCQMCARGCAYFRTSDKYGKLLQPYESIYRNCQSFPCQKAFKATNTAQKYCSKTCSQRESNRRNLERHPEKLAKKIAKTQAHQAVTKETQVLCPNSFCRHIDTAHDMYGCMSCGCGRRRADIQAAAKVPATKPANNAVQQAVLNYLTDPNTPNVAERREALQTIISNTTPAPADLPFFRWAVKEEASRAQAQAWLDYFVAEGKFCKDGLADAAKALGLKTPVGRVRQTIDVTIRMVVETDSNKPLTAGFSGYIADRLNTLARAEGDRLVASAKGEGNRTLVTNQTHAQDYKIHPGVKNV